VSVGSAALKGKAAGRERCVVNSDSNSKNTQGVGRGLVALGKKKEGGHFLKKK